MKEMGVPTLKERETKSTIATTSIIKRNYIMEPEALPYQDILNLRKPKQNAEKTEPESKIYETEKNIIKHLKETKKAMEKQEIIIQPVISNPTKITEQGNGTQPSTNQSKISKLPKLTSPPPKKTGINQRRVTNTSII